MHHRATFWRVIHKKNASTLRGCNFFFCWLHGVRSWTKIQSWTVPSCPLEFRNNRNSSDYARDTEESNAVAHRGAEFSAIVHIPPFCIQALFCIQAFEGLLWNFICLNFLFGADVPSENGALTLNERNRRAQNEFPELECGTKVISNVSGRRESFVPAPEGSYKKWMNKKCSAIEGFVHEIW